MYMFVIMRFNPGHAVNNFNQISFYQVSQYLHISPKICALITLTCTVDCK